MEDRTFVDENAFSLDDPVGVPERSEEWSYREDSISERQAQGS